MANYQKELDKLLEHLAEQEETPSLLLHSCCAPCSSYVLEYLSRSFCITVFFYNPNIYPEEEYRFRESELKRLIREMRFPNPVGILEADYRPETFFEAAKGLEDVPEGGSRCKECFRLRLTEAAKAAREGGFDWFTTTLTISPLKNAALLNEVGQKIGQEYGVRYLCSDFKKKDGYKRSIELSKEYDLYRQDYCGCVFSKKREE